MASLPPNPLSYRLKSTKPQISSHKFRPTHLPKTLGNHTNHQDLYKSYLRQISSLCNDRQIHEAVELLTRMEYANFHIGPEIYGEILQGCVYDRDVLMGKQIHARILKNGDFYLRNEYIETKLVIFYAKCGVFDVAIRLFRCLWIQNVFSWAAIIGLYCRLGFNEEGLMGFCEMLGIGVFPDNFVVPNALKACGGLQWIGFGRGVHGYVVKMGWDECVFVGSSLVDMYGKCGVLEDAGKVFDGMIDRNVVAWNSLIVGYVQNGLNEEAMKVFYEMRLECVELTRVTVSSFLSASANVCALEEGRQGHGIAVKCGLELDNILGTSLINFYAKVGLIEDAELVFSCMVEKDVVTWNLLISSYVQNGEFQKALDMCHNMILRKMRFDLVTLSSIISTCAHTSNMKLGKEGHCFCIRNNLESDVSVASRIVEMYAKCKKVGCSRQVFDSTTHKDLVLWNAMLAAYAELGLSGEALKLFYLMQLEGVPPNIISWNILISGFLQVGQAKEAIDMFSQMQSLGITPNWITWTTLISGLTEIGFSLEAIQIFQKMQAAGIQPSTVSITSALAACTHTTSLLYGRAIHGYVTRHDLCLSIPIATSLVYMYAKCESIGQAKKVFDMMVNKELPICNEIITGYALHDQAVEALSVYKHLEEVGIELDNVTFTDILSVCSRTGLPNKDLELCSNLVSKDHMKPSVEDYV